MWAVDLPLFVFICSEVCAGETLIYFLQCKGFFKPDPEASETEPTLEQKRKKLRSLSDAPLRERISQVGEYS